MSRTPLPPDVAVEEVEAGGVPCEWVWIAGGARDDRHRRFGTCTVDGSRWDRRGRPRLRGSSTCRRERVLSVNYRLAPQYRFGGMEDTLAVYR